MFGRWLPLVISILLAPLAALAMTQSSVPPKFPVPWGNSAGSSYIRVIPQSSQIGIQNCAASLTDGFPPLTFVPQAAGGCPPFGQDMNGVLKQVTQWAQWAGAGAVPLYDTSFSSSIGGYPSGAILANASTAGCFWISTTDNNVTNPDASGAGWDFNCPGGGIGTTASTGSANQHTVTTTPMLLKEGQQVTFMVGNALTNTGATQINVNGTGLKSVLKASVAGGLTALTGGEIQQNTAVVVRYDGTQYQLLSPLLPPVSTRQTFTSGTSATYTTAAGARQLVIRMVGGGGGGGNNSGSASSGSAGTGTTFNAVTANPGQPGGSTGGITPGTGGNGGSAGAGTATLRIPGAKGSAGNGLTEVTGMAAALSAGNGGSSVFGGAGTGGINNGAGTSAGTNSGSGGGGQAGNISGAGTSSGGGGGGSGEYVELIINNPAATYTYTVGASGAGASNGGAGAAGIIIIEERY